MHIYRVQFILMMSNGEYDLGGFFLNTSIENVLEDVEKKELLLAEEQGT